MAEEKKNDQSQRSGQAGDQDRSAQEKGGEKSAEQQGGQPGTGSRPDEGAPSR